ncbi:YezD family protein [Paenibacillus sp. J2TS4]|uniref:YezD family protein n=1 Tax=Paenibacillus sp. J2TS4 TaxID=2807194 RepID=UPI001B147E1E|nr:YezD family protein [Paenibacillus sp. J2TS4]GIP33279.1 hypothetical protein J2TS4_24890 [Paenibacillus sp. J2TS4]
MTKPLQIDEVWADRIIASVSGLEYGCVQIIVHDGKIVQIERTERKRFDSSPPLSGERKPGNGSKGNAKRQ